MGTALTMAVGMFERGDTWHFAMVWRKQLYMSGFWRAYAPELHEILQMWSLLNSMQRSIDRRFQLSCLQNPYNKENNFMPKWFHIWAFEDSYGSRLHINEPMNRTRELQYFNVTPGRTEWMNGANCAFQWASEPTSTSQSIAMDTI